VSAGALRRTRRLGLAMIGTACVALVVAILMPGQANAAGGGHVTINVVGSGDGFTPTPTGPLVNTAGLIPGHSSSGTMGVHNGFDQPSDLLLRLIDVSDDDNGCTPPEDAVDPSCGSGQGDLGADLVFTVTVATSENGAYVPSWTGRASEIEGGVVVARSLAAGAAQWVRVDVKLPFSAGNAVQTDTFGFGVRVVLQNSSGVGGVQVGPTGTPQGVGPNSSGQDGLNLPFTGTRVALLFGAGMLALLGGLVLLAGARIGRRRGTA
jgi:hypothetical protein